MTAIDSVSDTDAGTISLSEAENPNGLAVNPTNGRVYVADAIAEGAGEG